MLVSLCVALTEMLLLKNLLTVLELNAFTKIHRIAVNSAALAALYSANNIVCGLKRKIKKTSTNGKAAFLPGQVGHIRICYTWVNLSQAVVPDINFCICGSL